MQGCLQKLHKSKALKSFVAVEKKIYMYMYTYAYICVCMYVYVHYIYTYMHTYIFDK